MGNFKGEQWTPWWLSLPEKFQTVVFKNNKAFVIKCKIKKHLHSALYIARTEKYLTAC